MADFHREAARARRDEIRQALQGPLVVTAGEAWRTERIAVLLTQADALDAALSVSEQQTAALQQDNKRRENLLQRATLFLDYMSDHGGGDRRHIDGNGQEVYVPLGDNEHCVSCDARDLATLVRAALSVQPKEGER